MEDRRKEDIKIDVLTERVENWMETTNEYRKALCTKIDIIAEKMNNLPCRERIENSKNIHLQLKALWAVTGGMILAVLADWVRFR